MRTLSVLVLLLFAGGSVWAADPPARPAVIGHRGLLYAAPENTLAAFRAGLGLRVGFEWDIRRTKDGQLVCLHDETVDRTTSGKGRLADVTLAELRRLDAGRWFDAGFAGERVPLAEEVLEVVARSPPEAGLVAVDLKESGRGLEDALVKAAQQRHLLDRLILIGLTIESAEVRSRLKAASREAQTARLATDEASALEALSDRDVDWVYVRFLPAADTVARIHQAGKRVFLAGPLVAGHERENWNRAADLAIDAILTDFPLELARQLRRPTP